MVRDAANATTDKLNSTPREERATDTMDTSEEEAKASGLGRGRSKFKSNVKKGKDTRDWEKKGRLVFNKKAFHSFRSVP